MSFITLTSGVGVQTQDLLRDGLGKNARFHAFIAEWDGEPAAYALYYISSLTRRGQEPACS
jgi:hypothetical protein